MGPAGGAPGTDFQMGPAGGGDSAYPVYGAGGGDAFQAGPYGGDSLGGGDAF